MIDLHTHSLFSDGVLIPAELARRARVKGYRAIAITDHADSSNLDFIVPRVAAFCGQLPRDEQFVVIPGIELTHVGKEMFAPLTKKARALGALLVVAHGETIAEPVEPGTNRAALEAGVDILAHPGFITAEEALLARQKRIYLEITARKGHSLTNGYVARIARQTGAPLVLNTDAHGPEDLVDLPFARQVVLGAGLSEEEWQVMCSNAQEIVNRVTSPK